MDCGLLFPSNCPTAQEFDGSFETYKGAYLLPGGCYTVVLGCFFEISEGYCCDSVTLMKELDFFY